MNKQLEEEMNFTARIDSHSIFNEFMKERFWLLFSVCSIFGFFFTWMFYDTSLGLNVFLITIVCCICQIFISSKILGQKVKRFSLNYFFAILFGFLCVYTNNGVFIFIQCVSILCFMNLEYIKQMKRNISYLHILKPLLSLFATQLSTLFYPVMHVIQAILNSKKSKAKREIFIGIVSACIFLCVMIPILGSSDALFYELFLKAFSYVLYSNIFVPLFLFLLGFCYLYCSLQGSLKMKQQNDSNADKAINHSDKIVMSDLFFKTFFAIVNVVYLIFSGTLIYFMLSFYFQGIQENIQYASYVHTGFYQLVFTSVINFILLFLAAKSNTTDLLLKILLSIMSLCTYVMILSNIFRMTLYVKAYGLSFARVFVLFISFIIAFLILANILHVFFTNHMFYRHQFAIIVCIYVLFVFARPDTFIAEYNITHVDQHFDYNYLTNDLSIDSAIVVYPFLQKLMADDSYMLNDMNVPSFYREQLQGYVIPDYEDRIQSYMNQIGVRNFNLNYLLLKKYFDSDVG